MTSYLKLLFSRENIKIFQLACIFYLCYMSGELTFPSELSAARRIPEWLLEVKEKRSSASRPLTKAGIWTKPPFKCDTLRTAWDANRVIYQHESASLRLTLAHSENGATYLYDTALPDTVRISQQVKVGARDFHIFNTTNEWPGH